MNTAVYVENIDRALTIEVVNDHSAPTTIYMRMVHLNEFTDDPNLEIELDMEEAILLIESLKEHVKFARKHSKRGW